MEAAAALIAFAHSKTIRSPDTLYCHVRHVCSSAVAACGENWSQVKSCRCSGVHRCLQRVLAGRHAELTVKVLVKCF
jgi:hypothetical protein